MNEIHIIRGDSAEFNVEILTNDNQIFIPHDNDTLVFTLKKTTISNAVILKKPVVDGLFRLDHQDTNTLAYGEYVYDIQLTQSNGEVTTVIPPSLFEILPEVNFD